MAHNLTIQQLAVSAIRTLAMDAVQAANSGRLTSLQRIKTHPG